MRATAKDTHALRITRRLWLGVPVVGGFAWLLGAGRPASAQQAQKASLCWKAVDASRTIHRMRAGKARIH
jgi:hypothetical protein